MIIRKFRFSTEWKIIFSFALIKLLIHLFTASVYGFHKEEFFYLYLGNYPDVGYYSSQPLTGILSMITQSLVGNSTLIMRSIPAIVGAVSVVFIGRMVKLLNGGNKALVFTLLAYLISPVFLRTNVLFTPDFLDQFFWLLTSMLMLRLLKTGNTQNWILIGLVTGAGLLTKWSIAILLVSFLIGLFFSKERKLLFCKEILFGFGSGLLILSPSLLWQFDHQFPYFNQYENFRILQESGSGFGWYFFSQLVMIFPCFWILGFGIHYVFVSNDQPFVRSLGVMYILVILFGLLILSHPFYISGIYPILLAMGGKSIELWLENRPKSLLIQTRLLLFTFFIGLPIIPLVIPVMKEKNLSMYGKYVKDAGVHFPFRWSDGNTHNLPQFYGKMQGWDVLGDRITHHWFSLSKRERISTAIVVEDYKIASCIDYYARKHGFPEPICFQDNFLLHNPDKMKEKNLIFIGNNPDNWMPYFESQQVWPSLFEAPIIFHSYNIYELKGANKELRSYYLNLSLEHKNKLSSQQAL